MKRPVLSPSRFEMQVLGIFHRIIKSTCFNVFMILLGFLIGCSSTIVHFHYVAISNSKYEYVVKLEQKLKELNHMDDDYDRVQTEILEIVEDMKMKIAHDGSSFNGLLHQK